MNVQVVSPRFAPGLKAYSRYADIMQQMLRRRQVSSHTSTLSVSGHENARVVTMPYGTPAFATKSIRFRHIVGESGCNAARTHHAFK
jgi:hypothetical protein